jgi:hypothetical protein
MSEYGAPERFRAQEPEQLRFDRRLRRMLGAFYQRAIRPALPLRGHVRYGGVIVADRRLGDAWAPKHWTPDHTADVAGYEFALINGLSRATRAGDTVVVVGGGLGVAATHAASLVGPSGRVICYEGSPLLSQNVAKTAALNGVADRVKVECAIVGAAIGIYRNRGEALPPVLPATELPSCDVLELDCEGAEITILCDMRIAPRVALVETHGMLGASSREVRQVLEARSYVVSDLGIAEPYLAEFCEKNDVRVLLGERP